MPLTKPRVALLAFALSLLMLGSTSLYVYWVVQRQLSLEGRNLCSTSALRVDVTPATAVRLVHEIGGDARAFVDLDDFGIVRAFVAAHPESFDYPHPLGSQTKPLAAHSAVAGNRVGATTIGGSQFVLFGFERFSLVGRLGMGSESLLDRSVLIADEEVFARSGVGGTVVIDGARVVRRLREIAPDVRVAPMAAGASDRTNVDVISPVLIRLGVVGEFLGSVVAGAPMARFVAPWVRSCIVLGVSWRRVLLQVVGTLLMCCLAALAVVLLPVMRVSGRDVAALAPALAVCMVFAASFCVSSKAALPW